MKQEYVIVAGGAGFIGSHLCDVLLSSGYFVYCVDNLSTGSEENISHNIGNPSFQLIRHDVTKPLEGLQPVQYIFHLASPASVVDYQNLPEETALTNSVGTINLLKLAVANNARFLLASTSEIYGDPKEHPQKETYWGNVNSIGIRACYDESKRFGEMMTMLYFRKYHVNSRIVRIFNTYGPRMSPTDGRVISNFVNQAIVNEPITIYGDGKQTRSFCYVSDLVSGIVKLMMSESRGEVVNIGNPEEYTVGDLALKIKDLTGSKSEIIYQDLPSDDPSRRCPDISKAYRLLQWQPQVMLEEGLQLTIEYYKGLKHMQ